MTDTRHDQPATQVDRQPMMQWAIGAFLLSAVLTGVGTFFDLTGNDSGDEADEVVSWLVLLAVLAVITYVVYRYWYERAAAAPVAPNSALIGGGVAVVTVLAFWTGLPSVFAVGAFVLGRKGGGPKAVVGMVLAVLAVAGAVWAAIVG